MNTTTEELLEVLKKPLKELVKKIEEYKSPTDITVGFCREEKRGDIKSPRVIAHWSTDDTDSGYVSRFFSFEDFIEEAWNIYSCGDRKTWAEDFPADCERLSKLLLEKAEAARKEAREYDEEDPEA